MNSEMLELFQYWILEREAVRIRKAHHLPKPWSKDPIFSTYHFCNVRREDDRGTTEIRNTVVAAVAEGRVTMDELPAVYTAARLLNSWESLAMLIDHDLDYTGWECLKQARKNGRTVFHTAYVVSTCGTSMDKLDYCHEVVKNVFATWVPRRSCEAAYQALVSVRGLGSFLAGQVVADLKNHLYLADAPDWDTFSVIGPGSKKGLDILFGDERTTAGNYEQRITTLERALSPEIQGMEIHRQDLQNCLCEFSKYVRYKMNLPGRRRPYK